MPGRSQSVSTEVRGVLAHRAQRLVAVPGLEQLLPDETRLPQRAHDDPAHHPTAVER